MLPMTPALCRVSRIGRRSLRSLSTESTNLNIDALNKWIASPQREVLPDTLHESHLRDLYITIPTRDGSRRPYQPPSLGNPLSFGHHLVFFHPRHPESALREDGSEPDFCPPEPFTRRLWVGGRIRWNLDKPLIVGQKATATWEVASVDKKGFEKGSPMVFVNQRIQYRMDGINDVCVDEERTHVYLAHTEKGSKGPKEVKDIPSMPDFSFSFITSPVTLFRFSALIFNAHSNHLDKEFSQKIEGYPERLVHGPLTAIMMLDTVLFCNPQVAQIKSFEYRATNPLIVNRPLGIHGSWIKDKTAKVWCSDDQGVVGMTGVIEVN